MRVILVFILCYSATIFAQQPPQTKTEKSAAEDARLAQQQELISRLVGIANELKGEADKPGAALLQSEVADVVWRFDEPAARSIFRAAFDAVRDDITSNDKDALAQLRRRVSAIKTILKRYGLHDRKGADAWLKEFENELKTRQTNSNSGSRTSPAQAELLAEIALGMVSQDPKEAQRLGSLSLTSARIPSGFGRLLMALRDKDKALSDVLFRQALLALRSNGFAYDQALISLTNYAFFANGTRFPDVLSADVAVMTQYFVDAAAAQAAISRNGSARTADEQSSLGSLYTFLNNRALPIVSLNAPDRAVLLQSHVGEIAQALTVDQRQQSQMLASLSQSNSGEQFGSGADVESRIRRAEQEKNVATRDFLFRSLAMQLMRSDPEQALTVARKIDELELRAQTEDDVYLVLMQKVFRRGADSEATSLALKFNDLPRRARWLAQIAASLPARSGDQTEKAQLLSQAHSIAAKSDSTPVKTEVLLLIAKEFVRVDPERGFEVLSEAIGSTNRLEKTPPKPARSAVPAMRVISMTVVDGQEVSTDDRVTIDSLDFNQIGVFVERDYLRTTLLGNDIKNRFLRSKYFIALARSVFQIPRQGSGYERTLEDLISN